MKCILRDISFSGAKILMAGAGELFDKENIELYLHFQDTNMPIHLSGQVLRYETVEGRDDIVALAIKYNEDKIPMSYKSKINQFFS